MAPSAFYGGRHGDICAHSWAWSESDFTMVSLNTWFHFSDESCGPLSSILLIPGRLSGVLLLSSFVVISLPIYVFLLSIYSLVRRPSGIIPEVTKVTDVTCAEATLRARLCTRANRFRRHPYTIILLI